MIAVTVVIPSYRRPVELVGCLDGFGSQSVPPAQTLVVLRPDDVAARTVVAERYRGVRVVDVLAPGHLPPLEAGLAEAEGDVVAIVDDDAVPRPDWIHRLVRTFQEPVVAAVGGPVAQHVGRPPCIDQRATRWTLQRRARTWYGAFAGLPGPEACEAALLHAAVPVDVLPGGNMAFRREALASVGIDLALNRGAAVNYEADLCLGVRRYGEVLFDPALVVDHYPAPRRGAPARDERMRYVADYTYNLSYIAAKHFRRQQLALFALVMSGVGQSVSPGVFRLASTAGRLGLSRSELLGVVHRERLAGYAHGARARRARRASLDVVRSVH